VDRFLDWRTRPQRVDLDVGTTTDANRTSRPVAAALHQVRKNMDDVCLLTCQDILVTVTIGKGTGDMRDRLFVPADAPSGLGVLREN
jgi:hypothetical protein